MDEPFVDVPITTIADGYYEHDEQFVIALDNPSEGLVGIRPKHVVIIKDMDTPGKNIMNPKIPFS